MNKFIFLLIILALNCNASEPYESNEWKALLHVNSEGKSEVDDRRFFLSEPFSPKAEYFADIVALKDANAMCRFPARYHFIANQLKINLDFAKCENFNKFLDDSRGESTSISFASSYLESPMSYFGHTFITVNKHNNKFFSQTFSYTAEIPKGSGFKDIAINGVFGGFVGKFAAAPYFKIYEGYTAIEQRDITEYKLKLTEEELNRMIWHAYELYDMGINYKFLTNNCAYETLWLIQSAKPNIPLMDNFQGITIPYETINMLKYYDLIGDVETNPSLVNNAYKVYNKLGTKEKDFFRTWKNSASKQKDLNESEYSDAAKNDLGNLVNIYYDVLFKRLHIGRDDFEEVKSIPYIPQNETYQGEPKRLGGAKLGIGLNENTKNNDQGILLSIQPLLFNRIDDRYSELGDGTLKIGTLNFIANHQKASIESIDLFEVESYMKRFDFYSPSSWRTYIGADRTYKDKSLQPVFRYGGGVSTGTNSLLTYAILQGVAFPLEGSVGFEGLIGAGYWYKQTHIGVDITMPIIFVGDSSRLEKEAYISTRLSNAATLRLSARDEKVSLKMIFMF